MLEVKPHPLMCVKIYVKTMLNILLRSSFEPCTVYRWETISYVSVNNKPLYPHDPHAFVYAYPMIYISHITHFPPSFILTVLAACTHTLYTKFNFP